MASTTTHCIIAATLALPALHSRTLKEVLPGWTLPVTVCVLAAACDLDLAGRRLFRIPSGSLLSHRGLFHSPFFLIVLAAVLAAIATRSHCRKTFLWVWLLWAGCMLTHPLLDALTDGGRGVMLLLPVTPARLFFPWRPIHTPPGGLENIVSRALWIRRSEIPFCVAAVAVGSLGLLVRKRRWALQIIQTSQATAGQPENAAPRKGAGTA